MLLPHGAWAQARLQDKLAAIADSLMTEAMRTERLAGGTVLMVRGSDTLLSRAYGKADVELGVPTPTDAVYQIGSLTKQFTAAAVLQLAEKGAIRLDDDIRVYLPDMPSRGPKITVQQLLNHTSGLFDYVSQSGVRRRWSAPVAPESLTAVIAAHPLDFAPGSAMSYSNSGYFLLGRIIERVSGMSYRAYVDAHLLRVAGLRSAVVCDASQIIPHRVRGYDAVERGLENAQVVDASWVTSSGSLCMSAYDLIRWTRALARETILSRHAYTAMTTPGVLADGYRLRYADGLEVDSLLGRRTVHHGGDLPGFTSELTYLPDEDIAVAVLLNSQGPLRPDALTRLLLRAALGERSATTTPACGSSAAQYAGIYVGSRPYQDRTAPVTFRVRQGTEECTLLVSENDGGPLRLRYHGDDAFDYADRLFVFQRQNGQVTSLHVDNVTDVTVATRAAGALAPPPTPTTKSEPAAGAANGVTGHKQIMRPRAVVTIATP